MNAPASTELLDRVDTEDHVVGRVRRGVALAEGANFRTAHVFIHDAAGRLLLQRLAAGRERHAGLWGSSAAAYVNAGESYEEAITRRLREELCTSLSLRWAGKIAMRDESSLKFVGLFRAEAEGVEICDREEIAEVRFWNQAELRDALTSSPARFTPTLQLLVAEFGP